MKKYSREEIEDLISCQKVIIVGPKRKMVPDNANWRNDMKLQSVDGQHDFDVFMRKNQDFEENFSIGLRFQPRDDPESIVLLRCNGPHGPHRNFPHHDKHHIHAASPDNIKAGLRPEKDAVITEEYTTFDEALKYFLTRCNIQGTEKFLHPQMPLPFDTPGQ